MASYFGSNPYKFGLFGANCAGGMTLSAAPERWRAEWDDIVKVYQLADAAGIEFILPIAKWRGLGGKADMWGRSFETFTHSAAAGAITKRIGVFVTAHVPITTPAFAAKAITTIDHVTHGRAGLNIVCGWNPDEFDIHGATIDSNRRYDQGLEWFKIYAKICEGGEPFDWDGEFYKLRGAATDPLPLQRPRPPMMCAACRRRAAHSQRKPPTFCSHPCPISPKRRGSLPGVQQAAAAHGRRTEVYTQTQIVCRPTRKEAEDFYYYFAEEQADEEALAYFRRQKFGTLGKASPEVRPALRASAHQPLHQGDRQALRRPVSGHARCGRRAGRHGGGFAPAEGDRHRRLGTGISQLSSEMPLFVEEVLPRMERVGLRHPQTGNAAHENAPAYSDA